jgi:hypothetical protein
LLPESLASLSNWLGDYQTLWENSFDRLDTQLTKNEG